MKYIPLALENRTKIPIGIFIGVLVFLVWAAFGFLSGRLIRPPSGDEQDYVPRGVDLAKIGWLALADGYRPPGLPIVISFIHYLFGVADLHQLTVAVRLFNLLLVSAVPAMWWMSAPDSGSFRTVFRLMAVASACWPPVNLLAMSAMAEGPALLLVSCAIILALKGRIGSIRFSSLYAFAAGSIIGLAALFKANLILLIAPVFLIIWNKEISKDSRALNIYIAFLGLFLTITPWVSFIYLNTSSFSMGKNTGQNLLLGTGMHNFGFSEGADANDSLPSRFRESELQTEHKFGAETGLSESLTKEINRLIFERRAAIDPNDRIAATVHLDDFAKYLAIQEWKEAPYRQINYGIYKTLHSMGFSMRGLTDYILLVFNLFVFVLIFAFPRSWAKRPMLASLVMSAAISFIFLPNIRIKVLMFDVFALLLICACAVAFLERRRKPAS